MGVFEQFPLLTVFVVALVGLLVVSAFKSRRPGAGAGGCPKCLASLPPHAKYCSRCGHKV